MNDFEVHGIAGRWQCYDFDLMDKMEKLIVFDAWKKDGKWIVRKFENDGCDYKFVKNIQDDDVEFITWNIIKHENRVWFHDKVSCRWHCCFESEAYKAVWGRESYQWEIRKIMNEIKRINSFTYSDNGILLLHEKPGIGPIINYESENKKDTKKHFEKVVESRKEDIRKIKQSVYRYNSILKKELVKCHDRWNESEKNEDPLNSTLQFRYDEPLKKYYY